MTRKNYFITLKKMPETNSGTENAAEYKIPAAPAGELHKQGKRIEGDPGYRVYLLFSEEILPDTGDIISDNGREFEISEIQICRDISGKIRAVRCTTLN